MALRVSGRHMDVGEAFRTRIEDKIGEQVTKYFDGAYSGTVVLSKEASRFSTDISLHLDSGVIFQATGMAHDPDASFAAAGDRIEKRLRRYKRRLKDHKAGGAASREVAYTVMEAIPDETDDVPEDYAPAIVAETTILIGTLSVAGAVMELDRRDTPIVVFKNAGSGAINIVYRRSDGNYGWVDPSTLHDKA